MIGFAVQLLESIAFTASMAGATPLKDGIEPSRYIRLRFSARHTRFDSPLTFARPLTLNCLNPMAYLIHPNTGSRITLRHR